jgi:hypothetical protein
MRKHATRRLAEAFLSKAALLAAAEKLRPCTHEFIDVSNCARTVQAYSPRDPAALNRMSLCAARANPQPLACELLAG